MEEALVKKLIEEAKDIANKNNCCKHSKFTVGVSLLDSKGNIHKGFNIENHGIQSICAERVSFCKALTEGVKEFKCLAVVGKKIDEKLFIKTLPCGYCRQFISEYVDDDFIIYTYDDKEEKIYSYTIKELLPESFNF